MTTTVSERIAMEGPRSMSDGELLLLLAGVTDARGHDVAGLAWLSPAELQAELDLTAHKAAMLAAALELGKRGVWLPPKRGERCLDPMRVSELLRFAAREEAESFFVVMLDVRGRLLGYERTAKGSLSQCPVNPRDVLRAAVRLGAHSIVFAHNHPSGDPSPSPDDVDLTERLRAAAEIVGVLARDHVIVASGGYYSFVEAGRWHRA